MRRAAKDGLGKSPQAANMKETFNVDLAQADPVGRCRLTLSNPHSKRLELSA
jgi:hypothetical protein